MGKSDEAVILVAEDDAGHAKLIERNLRRAGLANPVERFENGQQVLDFLFGRGDRRRDRSQAYLLMLDIRMPQVDGIEVLNQIKADEELKKLPVIVLTTTDDPREIERCHALGCNSYIVKPVDYEKFADAIRQTGLFVALLRIPTIAGTTSP